MTNYDLAFFLIVAAMGVSSLRRGWKYYRAQKTHVERYRRNNWVSNFTMAGCLFALIPAALVKQDFLFMFILALAAVVHVILNEVLVPETHKVMHLLRRKHADNN